MAARVAGFHPHNARDRTLRAGDAVACPPGPLEAPAENAGARAARIVIAHGVVLDLPAAVVDDFAVVVAEDACVGSMELAEHDAASVEACYRVARDLRPELIAAQRLSRRGREGERRKAQRRQTSPCTQSARHTLALGRWDTCPCQRRTCSSSSGRGIRAGFMKSTATRPVMSATVNASPQTNRPFARCVSRMRRDSTTFGLLASPHSATCGDSIWAIAG